MFRSKKYFNTLLKLLTLAFALNATIGYGACCYAMDEEPAMQGMQSESCHKADEQNQGHEKCCAACFMLTPVFEIAKSSSPVPDINLAVTIESYSYSNLDPPFRPPIQHL